MHKIESSVTSYPKCHENAARTAPVNPTLSQHAFMDLTRQPSHPLGKPLNFLPGKEPLSQQPTENADLNELEYCKYLITQTERLISFSQEGYERIGSQQQQEAIDMMYQIPFSSWEEGVSGQVAKHQAQFCFAWIRLSKKWPILTSEDLFEATSICHSLALVKVKEEEGEKRYVIDELSLSDQWIMFNYLLHFQPSFNYPEDCIPWIQLTSHLLRQSPSLIKSFSERLLKIGQYFLHQLDGEKVMERDMSHIYGCLHTMIVTADPQIEEDASFIYLKVVRMYCALKLARLDLLTESFNQLPLTAIFDLVEGHPAPALVLEISRRVTQLWYFLPQFKYLEDHVHWYIFSLQMLQLQPKAINLFCSLSQKLLDLFLQYLQQEQTPQEELHKIHQSIIEIEQWIGSRLEIAKLLTNDPLFTSLQQLSNFSGQQAAKKCATDKESEEISSPYFNSEEAQACNTIDFLTKQLKHLRSLCDQEEAKGRTEILQLISQLPTFAVGQILSPLAAKSVVQFIQTWCQVSIRWEMSRRFLKADRQCLDLAFVQVHIDQDVEKMRFSKKYILDDLNSEVQNNHFQPRLSEGCLGKHYLYWEKETCQTMDRLNKELFQISSSACAPDPFMHQRSAFKITLQIPLLPLAISPKLSQKVALFCKIWFQIGTHWPNKEVAAICEWSSYRMAQLIIQNPVMTQSQRCVVDLLSTQEQEYILKLALSHLPEYNDLTYYAPWYQLISHLLPRHTQCKQAGSQQIDALCKKLHEILRSNALTQKDLEGICEMLFLMVRWTNSNSEIMQYLKNDVSFLYMHALLIHCEIKLGGLELAAQSFQELIAYPCYSLLSPNHPAEALITSIEDIVNSIYKEN